MLSQRYQPKYRLMKRFIACERVWTEGQTEAREYQWHLASAARSHGQRKRSMKCLEASRPPRRAQCAIAWSEARERAGEGPVMASAQLNVLISGGFSGAYERLLPEFERTSGIKVATGSGASQGAGPQTIAAQLA